MSLVAAPIWGQPQQESTPAEPEFVQPELNEELQAKIAKWRNEQSLLASSKTAEMELRKELGNTVFNNDVGTSYFDMGEGFKLKHVVTETYSLKGNVDALLAGFTDAEADMLVSWKPSLNVAAYKALSADQQAKFNGYLEVKPGAPTLEIIPPKTKK